MAIDYSAEIEALKLAIASGALKVSYDGKSVEYDSLEKMMARLRWLEGQATGGLPRRPTSAYASFDRGE